MKFYSTEDVAEMFHIHPNTVRRHIKEGRLPAHRSGRKWIFTESDIEQYLKKAEPDNEKKSV